MALTVDQTQKLVEGETFLRLVHEYDDPDFNLKAKVLVLGIGLAACTVRIVKIQKRGTSNMTCVGDQIPATFAELEVLPKKRRSL
jgi:hypothetical protein